MKTNVIITIVVILVVLVGGFLLFSGGGGESATEGVSDNTSKETSESFDKAPSFALQDYGGNEVTSADFPGKLLVVNTWATWCPFCVNELPDFGELQEAFSDEIVVIAIDRAEGLDRAKAFSDELEVTDRIMFLLDPRDSFYRSIGGFSMPETIFVDADGNIRLHKRGPMDFKEMRRIVNSILNDGGG